MKDLIRRLKSDNGGFTLLEVLVSMIILTIVCVPLLRSFATGAQTNARAKVQAKANTAAENTMEKFKNLTFEELDELVTDYSPGGAKADNNSVTMSTTANGNTKYEFTIKDNNENNSDLPDGYYTVVELDPDGTATDPAYPNANSLNLSDFSPISVRDCAIYTMADDDDQSVYKIFVDRNKNFKLSQPAANELTEDEAKKRATRLIQVDIDKVGDDARVHLKIIYKLNAVNTFATESEKAYVATDAYLFDATSNHKALNGIYLFVYPRYKAGVDGSAGSDSIVINNPDNVETNIYITAMNGAADEDLKDTYLSGKKMRIEVKEKSETDAEKGFLTLRTNLLDVNSTTKRRTPYSKGDTYPGYGLACDLRYMNKIGYVSDTDKKIKLLTVSDIDGKTLSTDDTRVRIYRVKATVYWDDDNDPATSDKVIAQMDGTKLR